MKIMDMIGLGSGEATTYIESDKPLGMKVGDEVPAVLKITKATEEDRGGRIFYAIEAEVIKIKGKDASVKSQDEEYDISKKVDEEMDMEMDDSEEDDSEDMPIDKKEKK